MSLRHRQLDIPLSVSTNCPCLWNSLPPELINASRSLFVSKAELKTSILILSDCGNHVRLGVYFTF